MLKQSWNSSAFGTPSHRRSNSQSLPNSPRQSPASPLFFNSRFVSGPGSGKFSFSASSSPNNNNSFVLGSEDPWLSSGEIGAAKRILVLVDALKEITTHPLSWTLQHVAQPGDIVTFAGLLPWLNIPLGVKRWAELSTIDEELCTTRTGDVQLKSDVFVKMQQEYADKGVFLDIRIVSGYPPRKRAVELAETLRSKWMVCYKFLNKKTDHSLFSKSLSGVNFVFLRNKDEGSISFAKRATTVSQITMDDEPGFRSPEQPGCLSRLPTKTRSKLAEYLQKTPSMVL